MSITLSDAVKQLVLTVVSSSSSSFETWFHNGDQCIDADLAKDQAAIAQDMLEYFGKDIEYIIVDEPTVVATNIQRGDILSKMLNILEMAEKIADGPIPGKKEDTIIKTEILFKDTNFMFHLAPAILLHQHPPLFPVIE